jgi:hypothetical protein
MPVFAATCLPQITLIIKQPTKPIMSKTPVAFLTTTNSALAFAKNFLLVLALTTMQMQRQVIADCRLAG